MATTSQRWMIRVGLGLCGVTTATVLALSLTSMGAARADTPGVPRLEVDLGMPMHPSQDGPAPATMTMATTPTPATPTRAPAPPADDAMSLKRVLVIDGPFRHGDYVWDEDGVPPGEIVITVDVKAQTIAVFRGGYQIGAAVVLYGADDYPTPIGTFKISQKAKDHYSSTYNNAPMPYMLRLTDDGVAIHASDVRWGNATHGCIGVPIAFAKLLFAQAKLGTPVIVTSGKMMAVPQNAQLSQAGLSN